MSSSKWLAAAALMALAVPVAQAGDRTRVQITVAPWWGWDGPVRYRPAPYHPHYGRSDYYYGGHYYGGPILRFDYSWQDRDRYYRPYGFRPGGELRYDSRRDRHYRYDRSDRGWDRDRRDRGRGDWRDDRDRRRDGDRRR